MGGVVVKKIFQILLIVSFINNNICFGNMRMANWGMVDTTLSENDIAFMNNNHYSNATDLILINKINIYPNPAKDEITINYSVSANDIADIYDVLSKKVMEVSLVNTNRTKTISVANLQNGTYVVKCRNALVEPVKLNVIH
jgi:arginine/lysine/ornithine decarboxylase